MISKIEYEDKASIQNDENIARKNKVTDDDMNEIKEVVNINADELEQLQTQLTELQAENTSLKNQIPNRTSNRKYNTLRR